MCDFRDGLSPGAGIMVLRNIAVDKSVIIYTPNDTVNVMYARGGARRCAVLCG